MRILDRKTLQRRGSVLGASVLVASLFIGEAVGSTFLPFIGTGLGYFIYLRAKRNDRLVLWLRKFNPEHGSLPVRRLIGFGSAGLFNTLTLQDRSFKVSFASAFNQWGPIWIVLLVPLVIVSTWASVVAVVFVTAFFDLPEVPAWLGISTLLSSWVACGVFLHRMVKRTLPKSIKTSVDLQSIFKLDEKVRSNRGLNPGITVLSTSHDLWQSAVRESLKRVDAVLFDISNLTESIRWEFNEALAHVSAARIVIVYNHSPDELVSKEKILVSLLGRSATVEEIDNLCLIGYQILRKNRFYFIDKRTKATWNQVLEALINRCCVLPTDPR